MTSKADLYKIRSLRPTTNISNRDRTRIIQEKTKRATSSNKKHFIRKQLPLLKNKFSEASDKLKKIQSEFQQKKDELYNWKKRKLGNAKSSEQKKKIRTQYSSNVKDLERDFKPEIKYLSSYAKELKSFELKLNSGKAYSFESIDNYAKQVGAFRKKREKNQLKFVGIEQKVQNSYSEAEKKKINDWISKNQMTPTPDTMDKIAGRKTYSNSEKKKIEDWSKKNQMTPTPATINNTILKRNKNAENLKKLGIKPDKINEANLKKIFKKTLNSPNPTKNHGNIKFNSSFPVGVEDRSNNSFIGRLWDKNDFPKAEEKRKEIYNGTAKVVQSGWDAFGEYYQNDHPFKSAISKLLNKETYKNKKFKTDDIGEIWNDVTESFRVSGQKQFEKKGTITAPHNYGQGTFNPEVDIWNNYAKELNKKGLTKKEIQEVHNFINDGIKLKGLHTQGGAGVKAIETILDITAFSNPVSGAVYGANEIRKGESKDKVIYDDLTSANPKIARTELSPQTKGGIIMTALAVVPLATNKGINEIAMKSAGFSKAEIKVARKEFSEIAKKGSKVYQRELASYNQALSQKADFDRIASFVNRDKNAGGISKIESFAVKPNKINLDELGRLKLLPKELQNIKEVGVITETQKWKTKISKIAKKKLNTKENFYKTELINKEYYKNSITLALKDTKDKIKYVTMSSISNKPINRFKSLKNVLKYGRQKSVTLSGKHKDFLISRVYGVRGKKLKKAGDYISKSKKKGKIEKTIIKKVGKSKKGAIEQGYKKFPKVASVKSITSKNGKLAISKTKVESVIIDMSYLSDFIKAHNKAISGIKDKALKLKIKKLKVQLKNPVKANAKRIKISKRTIHQLELKTKTKIDTTHMTAHKTASAITKKAKIKVKSATAPKRVRLVKKVGSGRFKKVVQGVSSVAGRRKVPGVKSRSKSKTNQGLKQRGKEASKQISKTITKKATKTKTTISQVSIQKKVVNPKTTIRSKSPIKTKLKIPKKKPSKKKSTTKKKVIAGVPREQGYNVYVKAELSKKWIKVNDKAQNKDLAHDLGSYLADKSLGAKFRVQKTSNKVAKSQLRIPTGYFKKTKGKFRNYKIIKGKKVKTPGKYIEKRGKRLDTKSEVRKIGVQRKLKQLRKPVKKKISKKK